MNKNNNNIKTAIRLYLSKLENRMLTKNSNTIFPCIHYFIFQVLKLNNDILQLPITEDISSVIPMKFYVRDNCVFYRVGIICPEKPRYFDSLKTLVQNYIVSALGAYGIAGLSKVYCSINYNLYSLFLDKVEYEDKHKMLLFDILYVCTEDSAKYCLSNQQKNNNDLNGNRTVYDDEV